MVNEKDNDIKDEEYDININEPNPVDILEEDDT